ncbi:D-sedoheptulose 7-phosphate isomerase OS=Streptomyces griseomycini OX=66895 GN=FHS37_002862 PE=4 SV=1 [Streptomyces griseomycini]
MLGGGGRLLAAGNGGSAAQAQHLTAEIVGRYRDDRPPFSAIALHADTSSTTAIANDYGVDEVFARQVRAHGREGDVLMLLSTTGASANLLSAADAARAAGVRVWALTGCAAQSADGGQ